MISQINETVSKYENVTATLLSSSTGFKMDENSVMIQSLTNAYKEVTKDYESKPICSAGGTYAREFKNCVAFGPEMEGYGEIIIHQPNERIQIRAIEDIMKIYYKAYADLIEKVSFK
jgi:succinyl-diaminopimelate desuccinylase